MHFAPLSLQKFHRSYGVIRLCILYWYSHSCKFFTWISPLTPKWQIPKFPTKACFKFMLAKCRLPFGQYLGLFQTFPDLPITFQFWQRLWVFRHFLDSSLSFISLKLTWHIFYAFSPNVYYHDSLSQQLRAVWDLLLKNRSRRNYLHLLYSIK